MKLILFLILSLIFIRCSDNTVENKKQKTNVKDEKVIKKEKPFKYEKFLKVPDYILNASGSNKEYYDAYDETLKLWWLKRKL